MCVIFVADLKRPDESMIERGFQANPSGAGAAWREDGRVFWKKGLELDAIQELVAQIPLPFVVHFRVPSCGGASPNLCHPFPIERQVPLDLEGSTKGRVLFHNGHWGNWKSFSIETAVRRRIELPPGKWSDTRAMAMAAAYHGIGILEMIDEKAVAFGPVDCEIIGKFDKVNDVYCSNTGWQTGIRRYGGYQGDDFSWSYSGTLCKERTCTEKKESGSEWCKKHQPKLEGKKEESAGGDSSVETFRPIGTPPEGGKAHTNGVPAVQASHAKGPAVTLIGMGDPRRWASALNPKPYRTGTVLLRPDPADTPLI